MDQLGLFPTPPKPPVKPVARKPSTKDSWTRVSRRTIKCDDCIHVLILAKGHAPVARMANWKYTPGDGGETRMVCHAHKSQRTDDIDQRGKK